MRSRGVFIFLVTVISGLLNGDEFKATLNHDREQNPPNPCQGKAFIQLAGFVTALYKPIS